jgi:amidase
MLSPAPAGWSEGPQVHSNVVTEPMPEEGKRSGSGIATLKNQPSASSLSTSSLAYASAFEAARAIRKGDVSSVEVTENLLKRIDQFNPSINAIAVDLRERALDRAREADHAQAHGECWGVLHGVPCTVKETFEIAGVRTTAGKPSLRDHVSSTNAPVVNRLLAAGAILVGKTNASTMGRDWQTYNSLFGVTNNPWAPTRTAGGSSGGSAAAVAAGLSYLCVGSDLGGSIRIPASFCGVYGHKPSLKLVPTSGHIPPYPGKISSDSNPGVRGPIARSAADLKIAVSVLGGPDARDGFGYSWALPAGRGARISDYRIGHVLEDPLCPLSSDIADLLAGAVEALGRAGAALESGWPSRSIPKHQHTAYRFLDSGERSLTHDGAERSYIALEDDDEIESAANVHNWHALKKRLFFANDARLSAREIWGNYFRTHDAFLLPAVFLPAFPHDHSEPLEERQLKTPDGPRPYLHLPFWVSFATVAGLPATVAPVGFTKQGLPVGIQILGPYLEDATPIELAGRLADLIGGFCPPELKDTATGV